MDIDCAALVAVGRQQGHQGFLRMRGFNQEMINLYVTSGSTGTIASAADVPVSGFGVSAAIAQGSSTKTVGRGIPVLVDYGGGYNGYITDETRSYVVGRLDETFLKPYEVAREIIEDAEFSEKKGELTGRNIRRGPSRKCEGRGWRRISWASAPVRSPSSATGSVLEINELPVITARHSMVLREGVVFAYEPKFVFPGKGVVGIEVDFITRKSDSNG